MDRFETYNKISGKLIVLPDDEIDKITNPNAESEKIKWGVYGTIKIDGINVFYKKIPLSDMFASNQFNTSNLYKIPVNCNYGFGTAGVNPWRELITHIKTSNWVLTKQIENFPLLYHYRIVFDSKKNFETGLSEDLKARFNYPEYHKYLEERANANYKVVMFLEYIPHMLYKIIENNKDYVKTFFPESKKILDFLESNGVLHLDTHWGNYLVDETGKLYLTDFGLVLDKNYELDPNEIIFMEKNKSLGYYYRYESLYVHFMSKLEKINEVTPIQELSDYKKQNRIDRFCLVMDSIDKLNLIIKFPDFYIEMLKASKDKILKLVTLREKIKNITTETVYL